MTRKDYVLLATALRNAQPNRVEYIGPEGRAWLAAVCGVAHSLMRDNARFDEIRFLTACGVEDAPSFDLGRLDMEQSNAR